MFDDALPPRLSARRVRGRWSSAPRTFRRLVRLWVNTLLFTSFVVAVSGCGPSVQVIHEGTVRFEHCYRLDLDPRIAPSHRHACWNAWLDRYSYGQPRDRIEYARRRVNSIERNEPPPGLDLEASSQQDLRLEPEGPVDAHAPPPRVSRPIDGVVSADQAPQRAFTEEAPGDTCGQACRRERLDCFEGCHPSESRPCPCEGRYRECMVACFQ